MRHRDCRRLFCHNGLDFCRCVHCCFINNQIFFFNCLALILYLCVHFVSLYCSVTFAYTSMADEPATFASWIMYNMLFVRCGDGGVRGWNHNYYITFDFKDGCIIYLYNMKNMRARNASPAVNDRCFNVIYRDLPWRHRHGRRQIARATVPAVLVTLFFKLNYYT